MVTRDSRRIEVQVTDWRSQADGSLKPVTTSGFLKRKVRVEGRDRQVALPVGEVRVLKVSFVDVQQGDGTLIQTPAGRVIHPRATLMSALGRHARDDTGIVFVTEMVAFFEAAGWVRPTANVQARHFFGFRRSAFGCVRVRTDGEHLLVFTDTGRRDLKEAYAYEVRASGRPSPARVRRA